MKAFLIFLPEALHIYGRLSGIREASFKHRVSWLIVESNGIIAVVTNDGVIDLHVSRLLVHGLSGSRGVVKPILFDQIRVVGLVGLVDSYDLLFEVLLVNLRAINGRRPAVQRPHRIVLLR